MKTLQTILTAAICATTLSANAALPGAADAKFQANGLDVSIEFYSPTTVRVLKTPAGTVDPRESLVVIQPGQRPDVKVADKGNSLTLTTSDVKVVADTKTGGIRFYDNKGNLMLTDKDHGTQFTPISDAGKPSYDVRQAFLISDDEVLYGLGQQQTGRIDQRNQRLRLINQNMHICIPFVHSSKGYGLYWDNYSPTTFNDNPQELSFDSEAGLSADYYFILGGNADGVIAGVRELTGQAPLYPLWTLGFWQSRERYKSPDELAEVVTKHRQARIPIDGIIQDWQYWGCDSNWNSMNFQNPRYVNKMGDPEYMRFLPNGEDPNARYPEPKIKTPKEMIDFAHANNTHMMISVWASFGPWTDMYKRMKDINALIPFETWPRGAGVTAYDPFNPQARDIYWSEMKKNIFDLGMDAWWLDSTEPDHFDWKDEDYDQPTYLGSFRSVHNAFPIMSNKGVYEHQRAATDRKRVFLLTRSSSFGQQRYGSHSWSGDVTSTWQKLRDQIAAGINYSLCGIPYWGTDLGGFFTWEYNNDVNNVAFHELHVRWYEWGAFQPIMRSHNSGPVAVEFYQFGKKGDWAYDALEKYTKLRYRLLPYLYSTTWEVTDKAGSILRPLVMDFAADKNVHRIANQHMFGRNFLVRPVTDSLYTYQDKERNGHFKGFDKVAKTDVYLPAGADWYDFWTNERLAGGQTVDREVPIDIMPVYVKAGSIVPWGPDVQYSTEKKWDNLEIRVYPGQDAEFTLYEDEFDNYDYEKGAYSEIDFKWNDATRTLTVGDRRGQYPGMLKNRKFNVVMMDGKKGASEGSLSGKSLSYSGKSKAIRL